MHVLRLKMKGFRSFRDTLWEPASLNVLIGPNGSGKSNLLRALELLSVCARGQLGRHIQESGGISPLLWDGAEPHFEFDLYTSAVSNDRPASEKDNLNYELVLKQIGTGSSYRIERELLGNYYRVSNGTSSEPFKMLERNPHQAVVFDESEHKLIAEEGIQEEETLLSLAAGPFTANRFVRSFQQQLASWTIYQSIDAGPSSTLRNPVVTRHETTVSRDGQNLINVLHTLYSTSREFKQDLNGAMAAAFGGEFEEIIFAPAADQRIQLRIRWKSLQREQACADLSDGTLRFLFLLAVLGSPTPPPLIAIDEPELGLHPSMLPIVAEFARDASARTQLVMTTHSPDFLAAFTSSDARITVVHHENGATVLENASAEALAPWLETYTLGDLQRSGELEGIIASS